MTTRDAYNNRRNPKDTSKVENKVNNNSNIKNKNKKNSNNNGSNNNGKIIINNNNNGSNNNNNNGSNKIRFFRGSRSRRKTLRLFHGRLNSPFHKSSSREKVIKQISLSLSLSHSHLLSLSLAFSPLSGESSMDKTDLFDASIGRLLALKTQFLTH